MHFLFWQPSIIQRCRVMPTTLPNLRDGCGFSGTDSSMLEIAGGLVSVGHGVRVLSGGPAVRVPGGVQAEVRYLSPERSFLDAQSTDLALVEVFVVVFMMPEAQAHAEMMDVLRRLTNPRLRVMCWCHVIFADSHLALLKNACLHRGAPLTLVCVSEFVRGHLRADDSSARFAIVPNAIDPVLFRESGAAATREPRSFIFCASYERGGRIAKGVHDLLSRDHTMGSMYVASYCDSDRGPSLSKRALAERMRLCDYMVYPLVLDNASVHHDTYACVVLEAMASGVLVVTWDVACLRAVYGDLITLLPPPESPGYDPHAAGGSNPAMLEPTAIAALADGVASLMTLPVDVRESRRVAARAWALTQTWATRVEALLEACV